MTTTSDTAIISLDSFELNKPEDLRMVINNKQLEKYVSETYTNIDVKDAFSKLLDCGQLLQVALTAAGDQPCSVPIVTMLSKYQTFTHDCSVTSSSFIDASFQALRLYKRLFNDLNDMDDEELSEEVSDLVDDLTRCFDIAEKMAKKAHEMATRSGELCNLAEEAIEKARKDQNDNSDKNKKIELEMNEMKAAQEANEELLSNYAEQIVDLQKQRTEAQEELNKARDREYNLAIIGAVTGCIKQFVSGGAKVATAVASAAAIANPTTAHVTPALTQAAVALQEADSPTASPTGNEGSKPVPSTSGGTDPMLDLKTKQKLLNDAKHGPNKDTARGKEQIKKLEKEVAEATEKVNNSTTNEQPSLSASIQEKESQLTKLLYDMKDKKAQAAANQKKFLSQLKNMHLEKTELEQTILLLSFAYSIMGEVKTVFLNVKTVWEMLGSKVSGIANDRDANLEEGKKLQEKLQASKNVKRLRRGLTETIQYQAFTWAGIAHISYDANEVIVAAREITDGVMMKLPTGKATAENVDKVIASFDERLQLKLQNKRGEL